MNQTPDSIERLEIDGDEENEFDEVDFEDSDFVDEESNGKFDDAEIEIVALTERYL